MKEGLAKSPEASQADDSSGEFRMSHVDISRWTPAYAHALHAPVTRTPEETCHIYVLPYGGTVCQLTSALTIEQSPLP